LSKLSQNEDSAVFRSRGSITKPEQCIYI
jgi:hypothetical protein